MSPENVALLNTNRIDIKFSFDRFKTRRAFCGVYSKDIGGIFVTFSNSNAFPVTQKIGRDTLVFICFFTCSGNFDTQYASIIA